MPFGLGIDVYEVVLTSLLGIGIGDKQAAVGGIHAEAQLAAWHAKPVIHHIRTVVECGDAGGEAGLRGGL